MRKILTSVSVCPHNPCSLIPYGVWKGCQTFSGSNVLLQSRTQWAAWHYHVRLHPMTITAIEYQDTNVPLFIIPSLVQHKHLCIYQWKASYTWTWWQIRCSNCSLLCSSWICCQSDKENLLNSKDYGPVSNGNTNGHKESKSSIFILTLLCSCIYTVFSLLLNPHYLWP